MQVQHKIRFRAESAKQVAGFRAGMAWEWGYKVLVQITTLHTFSRPFDSLHLYM